MTTTASLLSLNISLIGDWLKHACGPCGNRSLVLCWITPGSVGCRRLNFFAYLDLPPLQAKPGGTLMWLCLNRQLAGSMWARSRRGLDGRCWAEVYCGSAESGSWVHVDPLTGTVDRCAI